MEDDTHFSSFLQDDMRSNWTQNFSEDVFNYSDDYQEHGTASVHKLDTVDGKDKFVTVSQHQSYGFRGPNLHWMSFLE